MNLQQRKYQFIEQYMKVTDINLLEKLDKILYNDKKQEPEVQLTDQLKEAIDKGLQSLSEGKRTPHDEVMAKMKQKYPNLNFK